MHFDDTAVGVAVAASAAGLVWQLHVVPRYERRRQEIAECGHTLRLDAVAPPNVLFSTLRCTKCSYQEPAVEHIAKYEEARRDRIDALRVELCPRCGDAL